ncbi:hypothetical protein [Brevundimonas pondensis]|jgi:hypothetical protein|uniref:Uncharacterized protein n=1 Tax=Brevundimonas pondensis TaxID=2774189 RepID=A0ABX7SK26_9CAUL|nr:hypothetical protein [Brevundimonas pondensis]QTC87167.1 hypothetical protein IFE19_13835 [Brevundimonas pondensis]
MTRFKQTLAIIALATATTLSATAPAMALSEPLYDYIYYSDATKTVQVGSWTGVCYNGWAGVTEFPDGTVTAHFDKVRTGTCLGNGGTIYQ